MKENLKKKIDNFFVCFDDSNFCCFFFLFCYRGIVFDKQHSPSERVFGGRNGKIAEKSSDALDGDATPMWPGDG